jgi:aldehyde dehydrogenase (NAD+)
MLISETQRKYFEKGTTRNINERIVQLKKLKNSIIKYESDVYRALEADLGKSVFEAYVTEVGFVLSEIEYMIKRIKKLSKPRRVKTPLMFMGSSSYIVPEPYGTVLVIGTWNYPVQLTLIPVVGAIAAGNCVVIKPSEVSPNVSSIIAKIISSTFNSEYVACIEGGIEISQQLLSQRFDYIFYTGSANVGKIVMEAAAKDLTPFTLELGGKSPCIVDRDVNIKDASKRIAWGKFLNAGQTCVAPDYIYVHKEIKDEFIKSVIDRIKEFYTNDPLGCENFCRIISEKHFERLLSLIKDENIVYGGKSNRNNLKITPTIIEPVNENSKVMQEEIFGPIMPILEFDSFEQVITFINKRPKPLALYIFSKNKSNISKVLSETSSGGVCINDTINHLSNPHLPFGGVGDSGMGSYHGAMSFETFTHKKSVLKSQTIYDMKVIYPPYKMPVNLVKKAFKYLMN